MVKLFYFLYRHDRDMDISKLVFPVVSFVFHRISQFLVMIRSRLVSLFILYHSCWQIYTSFYLLQINLLTWWVLSYTSIWSWWSLQLYHPSWETYPLFYFLYLHHLVIVSFSYQLYCSCSDLVKYTVQPRSSQMQLIVQCISHCVSCV